MNRALKGKADSSLKSKIGYNNNNQTSNNNANNANNVGQNNSNNDKEGEQENEHIIECMNILNEQEEAEQFVISLLEEIIWKNFILNCLFLIFNCLLLTAYWVIIYCLELIR